MVGASIVFPSAFLLSSACEDALESVGVILLIRSLSEFGLGFLEIYICHYIGFGFTLQFTTVTTNVLNVATTIARSVSWLVR